MPALCLWLLSINFALATDDAELFQRTCCSCHHAGNEIRVLSPADKSMNVWGKYFQRKRHLTPFSSFANDETLALILRYLKDHAADSDAPESAVIPK